MAEGFRRSDPGDSRLSDQAVAIAREARRLEEAGLYTSTSLYLWLRQVRRQKQVFVILPIILGAAAGFSAFKAWLPPEAIAGLALLASLFPALADALKIQTSVDEIAASAAAFKSLQDRARQLATITAIHDPEAAKSMLAELTDRMDVARSNSITPPESYFTAAQKKIKSGDYDFTVDEGPAMNEPVQAAHVL